MILFFGSGAAGGGCYLPEYTASRSGMLSSIWVLQESEVCHVSTLKCSSDTVLARIPPWRMMVLAPGGVILV
jgi:hypothetical protein